MRQSRPLVTPTRSSPHFRQKSKLANGLLWTLSVMTLLVLHATAHTTSDTVSTFKIHPQRRLLSLSSFLPFASSLSSSFSASSLPSLTPRNDQQQKSRRFAFFHNPFLGSSLRNRLTSFGRHNFVNSRDSKISPYNRLSSYLKNQVQSMSANFNSRLRQLKFENSSTSNSTIEQQLAAADNKTGNNNVSDINVTTSATVTLSNNVIVDSDNSSRDADKLTRRHDQEDGLADRDASMHPSTKSININTPYLSPTLNVIDVEPDNTKIAHNILVVRKNSINKPHSNSINYGPSHESLVTVKLQTPSPVVLMSNMKHFDQFAQDRYYSTTPSMSVSPSLNIDQLEFVPIKNNHRPSSFMSFAKWKLKNKMKTSTTVTTPLPTTIVSKNTLKVKYPSIVAQQANLLEGGNEEYNKDKTSSINKQMHQSSSIHSQTETSSTSVPASSTLAQFITPTHSAVTTKMQILIDSNTVASVTNSDTKIPMTQWVAEMAINQTANMVTSAAVSTENPLITMFSSTATTANVTEFEPSFAETLNDVGQMQTAKGNSNDQNETAWGDLITDNLLDAVTTTENSSWLSVTSLSDDNSNELFKELDSPNNKQHSYGLQLNTLSASSTPPSSSITREGNNILAYHTSNNHRPPDESIVIFKNNHGRPRRPIPTRPVGQKFTASPPYVTEFNYPTTTSLKRTSITVANIVGSRYKQPDEIISGSLMVLDPPFNPNSFMKLPVNTTIMHKNLLVPMKEGRPKPNFSIRPNTEFSVYPVVASVSNWQSQTTPTPTTTTSMTNQFFDDPYSSPNHNPSGSFVTNNTQYDIFTLSQSTTPSPVNLVTKVISIHSGTTAHTLTSSIPKRTTTSTTTTTTASPVRPSASFGNAVYAPPLPVPANRPPSSISSSTQFIITFFNRFRNTFQMILPNTGQVSFMSVVRSVFYTAMVMLLPPLAIISLFS